MLVRKMKWIFCFPWHQKPPRHWWSGLSVGGSYLLATVQLDPPLIEYTPSPQSTDTGLLCFLYLSLKFIFQWILSIYKGFLHCLKPVLKYQCRTYISWDVNTVVRSYTDKCCYYCNHYKILIIYFYLIYLIFIFAANNWKFIWNLFFWVPLKTWCSCVNKIIFLEKMLVGLEKMNMLVGAREDEYASRVEYIVTCLSFAAFQAVKGHWFLSPWIDRNIYFFWHL